MEQRLEENNIKNENNRKKEYLRGYRSSRRRINRIDDEIIELKELAASVKAIDYSGENRIEILCLNDLGRWHGDLGEPNGKVIAWMPLPEPYKQNDEGAEK